MQIKVQRKALFILSWILFSGNSCYCDEEDEKPAAAAPPKHENFPRLFSIFSRPGDKNTEKQEDAPLVDHLGNVFKGGSIGFQIEGRPLAPFHGFIDKAKDFIPNNPFSPGQASDAIDKAKEFIPNPFVPGIASAAIEKAKNFFPIPFLQPSPKDKGADDRRDTEIKPKPEDQWESVEEDSVPGKEDYDNSGPKFEGIGDKVDDDSIPVEPEEKVDDNSGTKYEGAEEKVDENSDYYTPEPIENIIQPRVRQKRAPESQVFHVPLQFLSNAKPFEVRIK